jgi:hypothetical protein
MPALLNVSAKVSLSLPEAEVVALTTALLASVPADVTPTKAVIEISYPNPTPGDVSVDATITASMSDADLGKFVAAVLGAGPADAVLGAGSLNWTPAP